MQTTVLNPILQDDPGVSYAGFFVLLLFKWIVTIINKTIYIECVVLPSHKSYL